MKKTLIAAAVLATSAAYAQSSVEVYGLIDLSVKSTKITDAVDNKVTKTSSTASQGEDSTSRLGFRGTEDLGGGLKASFVIETGLDNTVGDRLTYLNLSSDLGQVTVGKFWNTFDDILTGDGKGLTVVDLVSYTPTLSTNGIAYKSPEFAGFTFGLGLSQVQTKVDGVKTVNDRMTELSVAYEGGPLSVIAAVGSGKNASREVIINDTPRTAQDPKLSTTAFKVSYDLDFAVPYLIYSRESAKTGVIGGVPVQSSQDKISGYEIGASFPMGAFTPYVTVARAKSKMYLNGVQADATAKHSGHQVGVNYDLSKRTKLYAVVGSKKSKDAGVTTDKTRQTSLGMMHTF